MIEVIENYDQQPVCAHCKNLLTSIWTQQLSGLFGKRYIYFCPHCRCILGVSHRKGFWMG